MCRGDQLECDLLPVLSDKYLKFPRAFFRGKHSLYLHIRVSASHNQVCMIWKYHTGVAVLAGEGRVSQRTCFHIFGTSKIGALQNGWFHNLISPLTSDSVIITLKGNSEWVRHSLYSCLPHHHHHPRGPDLAAGTASEPSFAQVLRQATSKLHDLQMFPKLRTPSILLLSLLREITLYMTFGCCPPSCSVAKWVLSLLLTYLLEEFSVSPESTGFDSHECCENVLGDNSKLLSVLPLLEAASESPLSTRLCHLLLLCHTS